MKRDIISKSHIRYMRSIAEFMYYCADEYNLDPEEMYFLGLNHDIGYLYGERDHEKLGADLLDYIGIPDDLIHVVRYHGYTPEEYKSTHKCSDDEIPNALILLWKAVMHVDESGKFIAYYEKLHDIGNRLGFDSEPYHICEETIKWLSSHEQRNSKL